MTSCVRSKRVRGRHAVVNQGKVAGLLHHRAATDAPTLCNFGYRSRKRSCVRTFGERTQIDHGRAGWKSRLQWFSARDKPDFTDKYRLNSDVEPTTRLCRANRPRDLCTDGGRMRRQQQRPYADRALRAAARRFVAAVVFEPAPLRGPAGHGTTRRRRPPRRMHGTGDIVAVRLPGNREEHRSGVRHGNPDQRAVRCRRHAGRGRAMVIGIDARVHA